MRKFIAAALMASLALALCACGRQPSRQTGTTTAAGTTAQPTTQAPTAPTTETSTAPSTDRPSTAASTVPANTSPTSTSPTSTSPRTTRRQTTARPAASARPAATTVSAAPVRAFDGAPIVLAVPSRSIDESLSQSPHTVYAVDADGRRFAFQMQAYTGESFAVDVYLDNRDGSYTLLDTFTNANAGADGKYSILWITPESNVTRDQRQNLALVENVYRFEISPAEGRYTVRLQATHAPHPLTAYYVLDSNSTHFVKYSP